MRAWAEIDLDALKHNIREIRRVTEPSAKVMAVIKADAYGHGFKEVAKVAAQNGVNYFAVATLDEAVQLRQAQFQQNVMILGGLEDEDVMDAVQNDISLTVFEYDFAQLISDCAVSCGKTAKIHIKLDTGMSRIGFVAGVSEEADRAVIEEILAISRLDGIEIEGIFSHFSTSDEADPSYTRLQFRRFMSICNGLENAGLHIPLRHIANSAAIMMYPEYHLDMVRAGIILYGLYPSNDVDQTKIDLKPVMTLKAKITYIKDLAAGRGVSYGKEYITTGNTQLATVPVGYADGFLRGFAKGGHMLVGGKKVPIVGRICMDQCMIDVTNVNNINKGDEVTIFTDHTITADTLAQQIGTINYEIICMISKRVPRIYLQNGKAVKELNFLLDHEH